jgi:O-antigen/teichoic acid export membrane protein
MSIKTKAKKALPYSVGISVLKMLVALFGMVLLIRYLSAEDYGIYALLAGLPLLLNIFLALGYDQYLLRYLPKLDNQEEISEMVWNILFWRILTVALASVLLSLAFPLFAESFGLDGYHVHFVVFQLAVLSHIGFLLLEKAFHARFEQKVILWCRAAYELGRFAVIIIGVQLEKDLLFFVIGLSLSELMVFVLMCLVFLKIYGFTSLRKVLRVRQENEEEKSYRWGSYIEKFGASFLGTDIDRYILAYFSTNIQVAVYAVATKTLSKLMIFYPNRMFKFVSEAALFSKYDQHQDDRDLNRMFGFIYNANNVVAFLFLAIFIPLGSFLLEFVFENDYIRQAYWPLIIFLCFLIFYNIPLTLIARAIKRPRILVYAKISFVINIAAGIPLAQAYGATGMALATAGSVVLQNIIVYILINQTHKLSLPWLSSLKCLLMLGLTVGVLYFTRSQVDSLFINLGIGLLTYLVAFKLIRIFDQYEANLFLSLLPKPLVKPAAFFLK